MQRLTHSILVLGPTGAGKSSLANSAIRELGGGAVLLAPGMDESNSYFEFQGNERFVMAGFDDMEFQPLLGQWDAKGLKTALQSLQMLYKQVSEDVAAGKPPRYPVLVLDTATSFGRLAYNATLSAFRIDRPPAARGGDGAAFYGLLYQNMDQLFRLVRAFKGLGVHIIALGHTAERENVSEAVVASDVRAPKMIVAAIPGGFRDVLPGFFDVVLHAGIAKAGNKDVHYLQWQPSNKRPTKSRLGNLGPNASIVIPNPKLGWHELTSRIQTAADERSASAALPGNPASQK